MIAWNRVAQLKREIGEADFDEVVVLFLEEVDEVIDRLAAGHDPTTLGDDLHFLKGSALNLGFRRFASLCQDGESAARKGAVSAETVPDVIAAYRDSRQEFLDGLNAPVSLAG